MSELLTNIHRQIDRLLAAATFSLEPDEQQAMLLGLLREELAYAAEQNPRLGNYLDAWPIDYRTAGSIADLPYLPAAAFGRRRRDDLGWCRGCNADPLLAVPSLGADRHIRSASVGGGNGWP